ncbi:unnamed protein product [Phytophthora fragariaefolia]|uniref:Unnamed protein product n=1 Tax=Phytophthora fragariaefolia TaxID=1490495 RepID=A0A9W6WMI2_9STRA|nr:unnamed protein product [Phytophthora fragariaefolia]
MFEDSEAIRDEKKQTKATREQNAADVMRDEVMKGMSKRKSKHDSFKELIKYVKERDNVTRSVELRKVANEEKRLALEKERLALERQERMVLLRCIKLLRPVFCSWNN